MSDEKQEKYVSIRELQEHLKTLLPALKPGQKIDEREERRVDAVLDIFNWAQARANEHGSKRL